MDPSLNILHLEDSAQDAELVARTLRTGGVICVINVVRDRKDFLTALKQGGIDLVLSDYSLPGFDGLAAIELTHEAWPNVPLIIVSGTLGEERAIEALQRGAVDYVLKDGLVRLVPAVQRALREVEERQERQRLESQFIEAQKMEAIGQLAGGVAHDFNNILGVIMGCGECIAMDLPAGSPLLLYTDEIKQASVRAAGLTQQLLVFSRNEIVRFIVLDLNEVLRDLDSLLRRLIGENIEMTITPGTPLAPIRADPGYIGQVLMNLVVNARDAMPQGGKLTVTTGHVTLDAAAARAWPGGTPGNYATLEVSDTGTGMTDEVKVRLFEAFFTTKPKGKGTGLGLATCHRIARRCGGHIGVQSELGRGTRFTVYFPLVGGASPVAKVSIPAGPLPRGNQVVLVVEDEPAVRRLACEVLKSLGYEVLAAANGQDALRVAGEHKGAPLRLVVTDVIMPLMGGRVMAEWLRTTDPELKILFTSGYTDEIIARTGALEHGIDFLPKPYTPTTLAHKVHELLDARSSEGGT